MGILEMVRPGNFPIRRPSARRTESFDELPRGDLQNPPQ